MELQRNAVTDSVRPRRFFRLRGSGTGNFGVALAGDQEISLRLMELTQPFRVVQLWWSPNPQSVQVPR